jgi:hypothetical protein
MNRGNRKSIEVRTGESRTTVERPRLGTKEQVGLQGTPDIESEERNAEIGINGDAEGNPGCAGKDEG